MREHYISFRIGGTAVALGLSWLAIGPALVWMLGSVYVPVVAPLLRPAETWGLALATAALFGISLLSHVAAHVWTARSLGTPRPDRVALYLLGDASHGWLMASRPTREALAAIAGPVANVAVATVAYLVWNLQLHAYTNTVMLFMAVVNVVLAAFNLAPAYPLDGGRLTRAIVSGIGQRPDLADRAARMLAAVMLVLLGIWGVILIAQRARFSTETGSGTVLLAALLGLALWSQRSWPTDAPSPPTNPKSASGALRWLVIVLLAAILMAGSLSVIPTNQGLEAPGVAVSVEPMVSVPEARRHPYAGTFILTTVFPQAPITAGQWVYGELSPVIRIVPPERIVPEDTTLQEIVERGTEMLDESEATATVVGLRLAGFDATVTGEAAEVVNIVAESSARDRLAPGDWIVAASGEPIRSASDLVTWVSRQSPDTVAQLTVQRNDETLEVDVPLLEPANPDDPPRIGIGVQTAGFDVDLPFPVEIEPQKISGGPSAGLMFTLTVYNLVTPDDLTRGRKIAGTGTIDVDGTVGPIGGVELKVAGAERAGAEYFFAPPENYEDARRVAGRIEVVRIATVEEAIEFLTGLPVPAS